MKKIARVNKREVINRFISNEINKILQKYNNIEENELEDIVSFINKAGIVLKDFNPCDDYQTAKEIIERFKYENHIEVFQLMIYLNNTFDKKVGIDEARGKLNKLREQGLVEEDDYYLINGNNEKLMMSIVEQNLLKQFEDTSYITGMFAPEEIAEMWIDRKSISEIVKEIMNDKIMLHWYQLLNCEEPQEVFEDTEGRKIMISIKKL